MKGCITQEHTVWCARARAGQLPFETPSTIGHPYGCESYLQVAAPKRHAIAEARQGGWINTADFGWLCPPCAKAYQAWIKEKAE